MNPAPTTTTSSPGKAKSKASKATGVSSNACSTAAPSTPSSPKPFMSPTSSTGTPEPCAYQATNLEVATDASYPTGSPTAANASAPTPTPSSKAAQYPKSPSSETNASNEPCGPQTEQTPNTHHGKTTTTKWSSKPRYMIWNHTSPNPQTHNATKPNKTPKQRKQQTP